MTNRDDLFNALLLRNGIPGKVVFAPQLFEFNGEMERIKHAADAFADGIREERFLFIHSKKTGTGKTSLAALTAARYARRAPRQDGFFPRGRVALVRAADFPALVRRTYHPDSELTEADVLGREQTAGFLVLDDLGAEKATPFSTSLFHRLIDARYSEGLPTIITSNFSLNELVPRLATDADETLEAERIVDRIRELALAIELSGPNRRDRTGTLCNDSGWQAQERTTRGLMYLLDDAP